MKLEKLDSLNLGKENFIISPKMENQKVNVIPVKKEILAGKARAYVGKQY